MSTTVKFKAVRLKFQGGTQVRVRVPTEQLDLLQASMGDTLQGVDNREHPGAQRTWAAAKYQVMEAREMLEQARDLYIYLYELNGRKHPRSDNEDMILREILRELDEKI